MWSKTDEELISCNWLESTARHQWPGCASVKELSMADHLDICGFVSYTRYGSSCHNLMLSTTATMVHLFTFTNLYYCNSILVGLLTSCSQNTKILSLSETKWEILQQLPFVEQTTFKILLLGCTSLVSTIPHTHRKALCSSVDSARSALTATCCLPGVTSAVTNWVTTSQNTSSIKVKWEKYGLQNETPSRKTHHNVSDHNLKKL